MIGSRWPGSCDRAQMVATASFRRTGSAPCARWSLRTGSDASVKVSLVFGGPVVPRRRNRVNATIPATLHRRRWEPLPRASAACHIRFSAIGPLLQLHPPIGRVQATIGRVQANPFRAAHRLLGFWVASPPARRPLLDPLLWLVTALTDPFRAPCR